MFLAAGLWVGQSTTGTCWQGEPITPTVAATDSCSQRCELPDGLAIESSHELSRWVMACADYECGRIDHDAFVAVTDELRAPPKAPRTMVWADQVVSVSSQYGTDSWSAGQVLGPPNVYPTMSDNTSAWATEEEDAGIETIEVSFNVAHRIDAVQVFETYNPGAVTRIDLLDQVGEIIETHKPGFIINTGRRTIEVGCTVVPIASVRVTLDTRTVSGWNELDAIGVRPCS